MSVSPEPPPAPWWKPFLTPEFLSATALATLLSSVVAFYTASTSAKNQTRAFNESFQKLIVDPSITDAFVGDRSSVNEEKAAATLLTLYSLAETAEQKRAVLTIVARELDANATTDATGGAAARLLTILVAQLDRREDASIVELTRSRAFVDLVTAGYANDYYNDFGPKAYLWTTLNGDQPITSDAKAKLLREITPGGNDGWVSVGSLATDYVVTSAHMAADVDAVNSKHDLTHLGATVAQYAVEPKSGAMLLGTGAAPISLVFVKARLLRGSAPVEFVNDDGTFRRGSLGRIVGVVPATAEATVCEPLRPVLVFVNGSEARVLDPRKNDPKAWYGYVHLWAHVSLTNCP